MKLERCNVRRHTLLRISSSIYPSLSHLKAAEGCATGFHTADSPKHNLFSPRRDQQVCFPVPEIDSIFSNLQKHWINVFFGKLGSMVRNPFIHLIISEYNRFPKPSEKPINPLLQDVPACYILILIATSTFRFQHVTWYKHIVIYEV